MLGVWDERSTVRHQQLPRSPGAHPAHPLAVRESEREMCRRSMLLLLGAAETYGEVKAAIS